MRGGPGAGCPVRVARADQPEEAVAFGELSDPFDEDVLAELEVLGVDAAGSLPDPDEALSFFSMSFFSLSLDAAFPLDEERLSVR